MKPFHAFKPFQFRYEELKQGSKTYLYRWSIILFNYSIRLHHWVADDVGPHYHDHPFDFISIVLKGQYTNVVSDNGRLIYKHVKAPSVWRSRAEVRHRLLIPHCGAWTLLFCSRPRRKWGFWVNNHLWRPLRYFHKYGKKN